MMDEIRPGQRVISADALNDGVKGGRTALGTRVLGGTQKQVPGAGQIIDTTKRERRDDPDEFALRDVVIKKSPSVNAGWVTVQRVQDMDWPIQPCTDAGCRVQVFGDEFEARPYFGQKTDGYKDFEVAAGALGLTTTFFQCRWDGRLWRLDPPPAAGGGETDLCLVHAPFAGGTAWGTGAFIRVVHVKYNELGGNYISAERQTPIPPEVTAPGYSIVRCWPGTDESFWQYAQSTQGTAPTFTPTTTAVYFGTVMIGGIEYIAPIVPIRMFQTNATFQAGDCG